MSEVETETEDGDTHGDTAEKKVLSDFFFFFKEYFLHFCTQNCILEDARLLNSLTRHSGLCQ